MRESRFRRTHETSLTLDHNVATWLTSVWSGQFWGLRVKLGLRSFPELLLPEVTPISQKMYFSSHMLYPLFQKECQV